MVYSFASICGGLLVTTLYGTPKLLQTSWTELPPVVWYAALYLGIFATAGTVYLVQYSTLRIASAKVMAWGYMVPVFVILWEGLLGHGWVALIVLPGVLAIVAGLLLLLKEPPQPVAG